MSERVVSVRSDLETLWRPGCEGEEAGNGAKGALIIGGYRCRCFARNCPDKLLYRKIERGAGSAAFARTVAAAQRGSMIRAAVMLSALMMRASCETRVIMTCRRARAMHRARYNGSCRPAQRRDPRRKKNEDQVDGQQAA